MVIYPKSLKHLVDFWIGDGNTEQPVFGVIPTPGAPTLS